MEKTSYALTRTSATLASSWLPACRALRLSLRARARCLLARVRAPLGKYIFSTGVSQTPPRAPWLKKLGARSLCYWVCGGRPADLAAGEVAPSATEREGKERERPEPAGRLRSAWRGALARASARTLRASARSARLCTRRTLCAFTRRAPRTLSPAARRARLTRGTLCDILSPVGLCCAHSHFVLRSRRSKNSIIFEESLSSCFPSSEKPPIFVLRPRRTKKPHMSVLEAEGRTKPSHIFNLRSSARRTKHTLTFDSNA